VEAGCGLAEYRIMALPEAAPRRKTTTTDAPDTTEHGAKAPPATLPEPEKPRADWLAMARGGRYEEAYRAAEADGIDELSAKSAPATLLLLGDVARLSAHPATARSVYLTARTRFPGSMSAATAAFYLGRIDLDAKHATSAKKWLLSYLDEEPDGPLAAAALGRLLEIQIAAHDRRSALALAKQYLDRYPSGPHSAAAEHVLTDGSHAR
jgi:TolA-binding protein